MTMGEMGERQFLRSIRDLVSEIDGARLGFDDDASDIPFTGDRSLVINVDTFVGKTDRLPGMTEAQVGRKTAVMALSDLVAKGASPVATMLSFCVPQDFEVAAAQEIIRGFSQYCLKSGIQFIGGDVGSSSDVVLTGVAIGGASPDGIVTRGGAKEGDIVAVTDKFGLTSVAFEILLNKRRAEDDLKSRALAAVYKPDIHYGLVSALAGTDAVTSSMDSSDGLGITLNTMAAHSKLSFIIDDLPVADGVADFARDLGIQERKMVMEGGEEFSLVLTIPKDRWNDALEIAREMHAPLWKIGHASTGQGVRIRTSEGYVEIPPRGYDNFREWE
ncbi:MAG: thiamine-phosphate kinase [Candidatus Thorarchaeota archaeon]